MAINLDPESVRAEAHESPSIDESLASIIDDEAGTVEQTSRTTPDIDHEALSAVIDKVKTDEASLDTEEYVGMILDVVSGELTMKTFTFFGHWNEDGGLVIDHAVEGVHVDVRPDEGRYEGGLWCASGHGLDLSSAERAIRAEYEDE